MKTRKQKVIHLQTDMTFDELLTACVNTPLPKKKLKTKANKKVKK